MNEAYMLTTLDNPFDPFNDFTSWFKFDCEKGHNTSSRIARIAQLDSEMTQKEVDEEMNRVMDFIIRYDLEEKYIKVKENKTQVAANA